MTMDEHRPSKGCDCPECRSYFDFRLDSFLMDRRGYASFKSVRAAPSLLDRMRAEDRPHLRDVAFLKFMGKVVGQTAPYFHGYL